MKFPIGDLVGEVRGDQAESRQCYPLSIRVTEKHKVVNTIFHLMDVENPRNTKKISRTLRELEPCKKETKRRGGPIEELESIKLDNQHPERTF